MGKYKEAEKNLEKAIKINPNEIEASIKLGSLYFLWFKREVKEMNKIKYGRIPEKTAYKYRKAHYYCKRSYKSSIKNGLNNGASDRVYALVLIFMQSYQFNKSSKSVFNQEKALKEAKNILCNAIQRLDYSKRWQIHLALAQLLYFCGEREDKFIHRLLSFLKIKSSSANSYYEETLHNVNISKTLNSTHPDSYFYSGIIQYKLKEYREAIEDFNFSKDEYLIKRHNLYYEAKRYSSHIESLIKSKNTWTLKKSIKWFIILLVIEICLGILWKNFFDGDLTNLVDLKVILTLVIVFPLVSFLPLINRFRSCLAKNF